MQKKKQIIVLFNYRL